MSVEMAGIEPASKESDRTLLRAQLLDGFLGLVMESNVLTSSSVR